MKLLNCKACQDIVKLFKDERACQCGKSTGRYVNDRMVEFAGPARVISMQSLDYHRGEFGVNYPWYFIPEEGHQSQRGDERGRNPGLLLGAHR